MNIRHFLLLLSLLLASAETHAGALTASEMRKLHPALQALVREQAAVFHGAPIFEAQAAPAVAEVIVHTHDATALRASGVQVQSVLKDFATVRIRTSDLEALARLRQVSYVEPGSLNYPTTDVSVPETGASLLQAGLLNSTPYRGQGAIVLIYDTGIDWKHMDFRKPSDPTKSRILSIWDQTITPTGSEVSPTGFAYGVEYTQAQIEAELGGSPPGFVRESDINGHGTHVAGTAAGNGLAMNGMYTGMAPDADIVVVKGGNGSFGEAQMVDGVTYAANVGTAKAKPLVLNWSIGGQYGAHDGTRAYEVAVDNFVSTPGRVVCISAGNDGGGLIHKGGTIAGSGGTETINIAVPAYTPNAGAGNDAFVIDLFCRSAVNLSSTVMTPTGFTLTENADQSGELGNITDGTVDLYNYTYVNNGFRAVELWVHDVNPANPPASGTWQLTLTNNGAGTANYDLWITARTVGATSVTVVGADNNKSLGMPATSFGAISVGSYVTKWSWPSQAGQFVYSGTDRTANISTFSSLGPTADGRTKPEVAAPGQGIFAALSTGVVGPASSSVSLGGKHWLMQGTSMASPHVTGAAALLLGANSSLTASQIKTLLQASDNTDGFTGGVPNNTWGWGKLDVLEALAKSLVPAAQVARTTLVYDAVSANSTISLTGAAKFALRFTPTTSGPLTGLLVNLTTSNNNPIVGTGNLVCELFTNNGGVPGTKLGSSVNFPITLLSPGTLNYVQVNAIGVSVTSGTDYFAVLSLANPSDALIIRTDAGPNSGRSLSYNGASWSALAANLRLQVIVTSGSGIPLPITLASFKAEALGASQVRVSWETVSEINNYGFDVERSATGTGSFHALAGSFQAGHGTTLEPHSYSYTDLTAAAAESWYRLKQTDLDGGVHYSEAMQATGLTGVGETAPAAFQLLQNYPNPFNPETTIRFSVQKTGPASLRLYSVLGQEVATLFEGTAEAGRYYSLKLSGQGMASGVYIYRLVSGGQRDVKQLLYMK